MERTAISQSRVRKLEAYGFDTTALRQVYGARPVKSQAVIQRLTQEKLVTEITHGPGAESDNGYVYAASLGDRRHQLGLGMNITRKDGLILERRRYASVPKEATLVSEDRHFGCYQEGPNRFTITLPDRLNHDLPREKRYRLDDYQLRGKDVPFVDEKTGQRYSLKVGNMVDKEIDIHNATYTVSGVLTKVE